MEKLRLFEDQIKGILKGPSSFVMLQFLLSRAPPLINEVLLCNSCRNFSQFLGCHSLMARPHDTGSVFGADLPMFVVTY